LSTCEHGKPLARLGFFQHGGKEGQEPFYAFWNRSCGSSSQNSAARNFDRQRGRGNAHENLSGQILLRERSRHTFANDMTATIQSSIQKIRTAAGLGIKENVSGPLPVCVAGIAFRDNCDLARVLLP
jgi:hypothetical protein